MERKILFVDDEELILSVLETIFHSRGYVTRSATDGRVALDIVKAEKIRVCFVDLRMPVMNGMELCLRIKRINPETTVFALSAFVDAYTPEQYREAGFEGYFQKPFKVDGLMEAARTAFDKHEQLQALPAPPAPPAASAGA